MEEYDEEEFDEKIPKKEKTFKCIRPTLTITDLIDRQRMSDGISTLV